MKKLFSIIAIVSIFILSGCGGSSGYNEKVCEQLKEKIGNKETLSESDINDMIDQSVAIAKILQEKKDECGGDKGKLNALLQEPQYKEMTEYALGFVLYLGFNQKELSPTNLKKLQKAQKDFESVK